MTRQGVLLKATMRNDIRYLLCLICMIIEYTQSQLMSFQHKPTKLNICDNVGNAVLIEHFFNLIFSELHDRPPVCVCVQMCIEQPTYCYPNGCLKIHNKKKPDDYQLLNQVTHVNQDNKPITFLVNEQRDFINHFIESNDVTDRFLRLNARTSVNAMRPDPFKDRYKSTFTIKKMPKVHLKYNLREQVKNMNMLSDVVKIDKIDVSNTRWPVNKFIRVNEKNTSPNLRKNGSKYFPGLPLEPFPLRYKTNFYKRDLTKNVNNVDVKYDDTDKTIEDSRFSLDSLIENLIDNSFIPLTNETDLDLSIDMNHSSGNVTTSEPIILPNKRSVLEDNPKIITNETTNILSINSTNKNGDKNKYMDATSAEATYKNVYNEMIATLSRNIEKQNNSSLEIMEKFSDDNLEVNIESPTESNSTNSEMIIETTTIEDYTTTKEETTIETTNKPTPTEMKEITSSKKSRQRISRKLHNSKIN